MTIRRRLASLVLGLGLALLIPLRAEAQRLGQLRVGVVAAQSRSAVSLPDRAIVPVYAAATCQAFPLPARMAIYGLVGAGFGVVLGQLVDKSERPKVIIGMALFGALSPLWHDYPAPTGCMAT